MSNNPTKRTGVTPNNIPNNNADSNTNIEEDFHESPSVESDGEPLNRGFKMAIDGVEREGQNRRSELSIAIWEPQGSITETGTAEKVNLR